MEITLTNSEYNFIKKVLKKDVNKIFTNKFKTFLKDRLIYNDGLGWYNGIEDIEDIKIKSILNKLKLHNQLIKENK